MLAKSPPPMVLIGEKGAGSSPRPHPTCQQEHTLPLSARLWTWSLMWLPLELTATGVPGPWWLGLISTWAKHLRTGDSQSRGQAGSPLGIPWGPLGNVDFRVRLPLPTALRVPPTLQSLFPHCAWGENTFVRQRGKWNEIIHGKPWCGNSLPASHNCPSCLLGHLPWRTVS